MVVMQATDPVGAQDLLPAGVGSDSVSAPPTGGDAAPVLDPPSSTTIPMPRQADAGQVSIGQPAPMASCEAEGLTYRGLAYGLLLALPF